MDNIYGYMAVPVNDIPEMRKASGNRFVRMCPVFMGIGIGQEKSRNPIARNFRVLQNAIPFHLMKTENDSFAVQSESVRLATREYRMNPAIPPLPVFVGIFHPGKGNRHLTRTTAGQNPNTGKAANPVPYPGWGFGSPTGPGNGNRQKCCPTCQPNRFPMRYQKS